MKKKSRKIAGIAVCIVVLAFFLVPKIIPFPELTEFLTRPYSQVFLSSDGVVLQVGTVGEGVRREFTALEKIPEKVQKAFLKAEDSRFYWHYGVDVFAVCRALFQNVFTRKQVSGASTVTMQLARIVSPEKNRTIWNKIRECFQAYLIEGKLSKKQILELYLNNLPFGSNVEGITSAAWYFFGKKPENLTDAEILCLAVIPRRPESYNPVKFPENTAGAAFLLAGKKSGLSEQDLLETASGAEIHRFPFYAPHAVIRVQNELHKKTVENQADFSEIAKSPVILTLDSSLQFMAEYEVKNHLAKNGTHRIDNGACFVMENNTGRILAYVGSNDWFDEEHSGQIDGITVRNQMGSSMKPFLYAAALEAGILKPNSVLADIPMEFGSENVYFPQNFNNRYNGPVLLRKTLASSLNVPAVHTLSLLGVQNYIRVLRKLGFDSLDEKQALSADLGLSLGAGEVALEELVRAFSVFASEGRLVAPFLIESPVMINGSEDEPVQVFEKDTIRIIADFLSDKSARAGGFGLSQSFETVYPSIFKTGTANQYQSIVAVGATPRYTVGVWMGNFSGNTVMGKTGSSLPADIACKLLDYLTERDESLGLEPENFGKPVEYDKVEVCSVSGMLPGKNCRHTINEYCRKDSADDMEVCSWHVEDPDGSIQLVLPAIYEPWMVQSGIIAGIDYGSHPLTIVAPANGSVFYKNGDDANQQIPVSVIGGGSADDLWSNEKDLLSVFYDDNFFEIERPFIFSVPVEKGIHNLTVRTEKEEACVSFTVK